ncbi:ribonuclease H-like domain-containing protein [Tanacetum coccineum]
MQEPERPLTKKDQVAIDEDLARNIQAQLDAKIIKEERLERQKQVEANIALIESWENRQAMMKADRLLAERLQTREREELTDEEKGKLFMELMEKRRKHFAKLRVQAKRNRPPTKKATRRRKNVVRRKLKAAERRFLEGKEQQQESSKKQRMKEDKETDEVEEVEEDDEAELKKHLVIKQDDDIAIDAIPLATKPPMIVDYKLLKEGIMGIDKEDLLTLWKLVKTKHGDIRPEDDHERVMWGDFKVTFELDIRSKVWRDLQGYTVFVWKLYDSCGVHFARFRNVHIFMLVEKRYPITPITVTNMLNKKLQTDLFNEMCYQLLKLMIQKMNIKFKGGLLGFKRLQGFLEVTTAQSTRTEKYLTHTDYALWEVIVNGDAPVVASASTEGPIPPKTAKQKIARKNELKAKSTLLLAIPDEHLLKFHGIKDAKSLWEAIKTRFQKLISQLEIQGEVISQEDANLKLLRSLPSAWNNIALIMRNKPDLDELSMDDLYNNLKVYEAKIKSQSSSNSNSQNVAFVSSENTSSTNEAVNTALDVSTASTQGQASSSTYADDVMFSFFVNQSKSPLLDNEDMEQIDSDDLEEMDLKWQVAMLTMRIKRFIKKTRRNLNLNGKEAVGLDMTKVECYNCHRKGHFARDYRAPRIKGNRNGDNARRVVPVETSTNALVV